MTSNVLSLVQVLFLKMPGVMKFFDIPQVIPPKMDPNVKTGTFMENLRAGKNLLYIKSFDKKSKDVFNGFDSGLIMSICVCVACLE